MFAQFQKLHTACIRDQKNKKLQAYADINVVSVLRQLRLLYSTFLVYSTPTSPWNIKVLK